MHPCAANSDDTDLRDGRREFNASLCHAITLLMPKKGDMDGTRIDRTRLVRRHNPHRTASSHDSPMQVGNGRFAFGVDITGLQTFVPFATLSEWGWKTDPFPEGASMDDYRGQTWNTHGRDVVYDMPDAECPAVSQWLIANPNRMNLGRIGLWFGGAEVIEADLESCTQTLDMWTGTIKSTVLWHGFEIHVETSVHPEEDTIGIKITSSLVQTGRLGIFLDYPYNDGRSKFSAPYTGIWDEPQRHTTVLENLGEYHAHLRRRIDDTQYRTYLSWDQSGMLCHLKDHRFILKFSNSTSSVNVTATFLPEPIDDAGHISSVAVFEASKEHWQSFWTNGGAIDLSESSDIRWRELERRIVTSQYVMAVNATGDYPPQESGLVNLGWYGKFHMEMNWWHTAYLALFNRWPLLYRSLSIYKKFLPSSMERAKRQGYKGARWPKMTDPSGRMAPGEINSLLIWQQVHPIAFAELDYRAHPTAETLERWCLVVDATADFMASYAVWDEAAGAYRLGGPMHIVSENTDPRKTYNPAFELEYWRFGLSVAVKWREHLGQPAPEEWIAVLTGLAAPPMEDDLYVICAGAVKDMWTSYNWEHPSLAGLYGWLPGSTSLDLATVRATSQRVWDAWHLDDCWGWDFGVLAMNAARLGEPSRAVDFLLNANMVFDDVGFEPGGRRVPFPYLPSAGSLLYAVAFMARGWTGSGNAQSPGFPKEGWVVRMEDLNKAL